MKTNKETNRTRLHTTMDKSILKLLDEALEFSSSTSCKRMSKSCLIERALELYLRQIGYEVKKGEQVN